MFRYSSFSHQALMRPGRLDRLVYVPLPDSSTRQDIFAIRLADVPLSGDVNMEELVTRTEMYSGAEVRFANGPP